MTSNLKVRHDIQDLEEAILTAPQVDIEVKHYFAHGLYAREARIPKGVVCTGKIHLYSHINVISQGSILVKTEEVSYKIAAPYTMVSPPGTKRAGYALEDTIWTTFHACETDDLEEAERLLVCDTHEEFKEILMLRKED